MKLKLNPIMETINSLPLITENHSNSQTLNPPNILHRGKQIKLKSNPIFRYNYFLTCYNTSYNMINGVKLQILPRNKIYYCCFPILSVKYFVLQVLFDFIPYFNLLWSIFLVFMWVVYERAYLVYRSNCKKVSNPFKKMIYEPEICKKFKCMNKFLEIPSEFLGETGVASMKIMIYNDNFKKMQNQFPNYRYLHMLHLIFAIFIMTFSYIWLYQAIGIESLINQ